MQNAKPMTDLIAGIVAQFATSEIMARLEAEDVPHARVLKRAEVLTNEQVVVNGTVTTFEDPRAGKMRLARNPARFDHEPLPVRRHAPSLGEHTDEVLRELGRTAEEIAKLRASAAVG
jgi:crotonobetainyl-CoA:carnitine CoA-transferase CaiB-like acyl-CoA transferase